MTLITEEQYAVFHPHLPVQRGNVRIPNRIVVSARIYVLENRCSWRALPKHFGKWHTVYMQLHRWDEAGVLGRLIDALREQQLIGADIDRRHLDSISPGGQPDGTGTKKQPAKGKQMARRKEHAGPYGWRWRPDRNGISHARRVRNAPEGWPVGSSATLGRCRFAAEGEPQGRMEFRPQHIRVAERG